MVINIRLTSILIWINLWSQVDSAPSRVEFRNEKRFRIAPCVVISGKIDNATWSVKSKTGAITFHSQHELIHIETAGVYHVYGQLEYMSSNNNTREVMGHCIVSGQNTTTLQPEQCAKISPHNRIHHQHRHNYTWFNHGTKYVSGTFALAENSYVGIRLEFNPAANRDFVLFRPIGCYFGAFKVA